ncbi:MAG TPA: ABC transporter permease [Blastocatellia bacterium]|nr:ABC transporter permease [Blastocatellia bacterium]
MQPDSDHNRERPLRLWLSLIRFIGLIVPRRLRADWRQEWEAELRWREAQLAEWGRLDWRSKPDLLRRSLGSLRDALLLQPRRLEDEMFQDVRFGMRMLRRHPGLAAVAVIAIALGIGANTAVFSVVNAVLLRPLAYRDADGLVMVWGNFLKLGLERLGAKAAEYADYRHQSHVFAELAAFNMASFSLTESGYAPERISGARVTASLFPLLGAQAAAGRTFAPDENEAGRDKVVIISHGLWQRRFGADLNIAGKTLVLDGQSYAVAGVLPADFQFPHRSFPFAEPAEVFVPIVFDAAQVAKREGQWENFVIGRLNRNVTLQQARAQMNALAGTFEQQYRGYRGPNGEDGGWRITLEPLQSVVTGSSRTALFVLMGIVSLVLLIACASVANLLLARAAARQKEIAVRLAMGATRRRIIRQLLTESSLLALSGGALGLLLADRGTALLVRLNPGSLPRADEISIDGRVLIFTVAASVLTGLLSGLAPALAASRADLNRTLKESGAPLLTGWRRIQLRHLLVTGEIALALMVLVCAGLMLNSFLRLTRVNPGLDAQQVLTAEISLPAAKYADRAQAAAFYEQLLAKITTLPGVQSAGLSSITPLSGAAIDDPFSIEGRPLDPNHFTVAGHQTISPGFFRTLGISILQGRDFTASDAAGVPPVAIINEAMARTYWPNQNPLGQRLKLGAPRAPANWAAIVGVVRDIPHRGLDSAPKPDWYLPHAQSPARTMTLFVRTAADPAALSAAIRREVQAIDAAQPVTGISTLSQVIDSSVAPRRFQLLLLGVFAAVALLLSTTGIYGVMSYLVAQRTREVGLRLALGAQTRDVLKLMLRQGLTLALAGAALGLIGSIAVTRVMKSLLYGISATDPATFAVVTLLLVGVALAACWIPARRATRVDPVTALRYE